MQADLRPILLRRMKEDVEQLPEKEEVIVWVELTRQQRLYYKALFTQQVQLPSTVKYPISGSGRPKSPSLIWIPICTVARQAVARGPLR
jgi:SNF2 family DNA or RNA helicase